MKLFCSDNVAADFNAFCTLLFIFWPMSCALAGEERTRSAIAAMTFCILGGDCIVGAQVVAKLFDKEIMPTSLGLCLGGEGVLLMYEGVCCDGVDFCGG